MASGNNKINFSEVMSGNSGYKVIKIQLPSSIYDKWVRQKKGEVIGKITLDKPVKDIGEQQERNIGTLNCSCTEAKCSITLDPIKDNNIVFNEDAEGYSIEGVLTHSCKAIVTQDPAADRKDDGRSAFSARVTTDKEIEMLERKKNAEASKQAAAPIGVKRAPAREAHKAEPNKKAAKIGTIDKGEFVERLIKAFSGSPELTLDQIKEKTRQEGRFRFKGALEEYCNLKDGKYTLKDSIKGLIGN